MCFYDQHRFACGDWKWGHFRQHCNREYRIGETCGMKLIMQTVPIGQKCKLCERIDTKMRRRAAEVERVNRWQRHGGKFRASIDKSKELIQGLDTEIYDLSCERNRRLQGVGSIHCDDAECVDSDPDECIGSDSSCRTEFRMVPKLNSRRGLPITFEELHGPATVMACADTGSECNAVSLDLAIALGLRVDRSSDREFTMANGATMRCYGRTQSVCGFGIESHVRRAGVSCRFYVFKSLVSPLIMCWSFLHETQTLTRYSSRFVRLPQSRQWPPRVRALGDCPKRLTCSLDGEIVEVLPDSGAEVDLMSEAYAIKRGFTILPEQALIAFANGTKKSTTGTVSARLCIPPLTGRAPVISGTSEHEPSNAPSRGKEESERKELDEHPRQITPENSFTSHKVIYRKAIESGFHVVKGLTVDVLVGDNSLESLGAYRHHPDSFVEIERVTSAGLECNRIVLLGKIEQRLRSWTSRSSRELTGSPPHLHFEQSLNEADQSENARRERERQRWTTLTAGEQGVAEAEENERQRRYDEYRTALVQAFGGRGDGAPRALS